MSDPLFLVGSLPEGEELTLDGPEGHHAATVARLRVGETLLIGDGQGTIAHARVAAVGKGTLTVVLGERVYEPAPTPRIVVVQAIAKGDRGELAVQAMTEVGVDVIVPWSAARSIAQWNSDKQRQRWVDTARAAAKQSRRAWVPVIEALSSTKDLLGRVANAFVLHEAASARLSSVDLPAAGDVVLVVGPEGGITDDELNAFEAAGAQSVRLGSSVLRTSTAGPAAIAVLSVALGRW